MGCDRDHGPHVVACGSRGQPVHEGERAALVEVAAVLVGAAEGNPDGRELLAPERRKEDIEGAIICA